MSRRISAFSLVELVLSLGIVSFAMVSTLGLIPVGMRSFREAMNLSLETTVAQRLISDIQASQLKSSNPDDYDEAFEPHYFDDQGIPVRQADAVFTARAEKPSPLSAGRIIGQNTLDSARTIVVRITNRAEPNTARIYSVIMAATPQ